jgi:hypothetical protein
MGPRYRETCERNLRLHMTALEDLPLRAITPQVVREWYASALWIAPAYLEAFACRM